MKETNFNQVILKTALISFVSVIITGILSLSVLTIFSPVSLARFTSSLGLNGVSTYYYERAYQKTGDINTLYHLLNKNIATANEEKIVINFERLFDSGAQKYYDFIDYINEYNLSSSIDPQLKLYVANEDGRLKSRYVTALMRTQKTGLALQMVAQEMLDVTYTSTENTINFLLGAYVSELLYENATLLQYEALELYEYEQGQYQNIIENAHNFYQVVRSLYVLEFDNLHTVQNYFDLGVTCNSLIKIANTLLILDNKLELTFVNKEQLELDMLDYFSQFAQINNQM